MARQPRRGRTSEAALARASLARGAAVLFIGFLAKAADHFLGILANLEKTKENKAKVPETAEVRWWTKGTKWMKGTKPD